MDPDSLLDVALLIAALALLLVSATAEYALATLSRARYQRMLEQGKHIEIVGLFVERPGHYLAIVNIARVLSAVSIAALATILVAKQYPWGYAPVLGALATLAAVLILGQIVPRAIAVGEPESALYALAWPLRGLALLLGPIARVVSAATSALAQVLGHPAVPEGPVLTPAELRVNLAAAEEEGFIQETERDMIDSIFELEDTTVREVMVPRMDIVGLPATTTVSDAVGVFVKDGFSRLPVYNGSLDNITGILYAKDLFPTLKAGQMDGPVGPLARPAYFVPESKKTDELLHEMQQRKVHIAIVVDEYGGTGGLITIEDLLEEIVGEIRDEFDAGEEEKITETKDGEAIFDATVSIDDVNDTLGLHLQGETVDTIGGLVVERLGRVAQAGDQAEVDGALITVISTAGRRIRKVKVTATASAENGKSSGY